MMGDASGEAEAWASAGELKKRVDFFIYNLLYLRMYIQGDSS